MEVDDIISLIVDDPQLILNEQLMLWLIQLLNITFIILIICIKWYIT